MNNVINKEVYKYSSTPHDGELAVPQLTITLAGSSRMGKSRIAALIVNYLKTNDYQGCVLIIQETTQAQQGGV